MNTAYKVEFVSEDKYQQKNSSQESFVVWKDYKQAARYRINKNDSLTRVASIDNDAWPVHFMNGQSMKQFIFNMTKNDNSSIQNKIRKFIRGDDHVL